MKNSKIWLAVITMTAGWSVAVADQLILDDFIVDGRKCVGFDCVNGESFGLDTVRLKENNLRIKFQDTSDPNLLPASDWQITINDSANGGGSCFSIDDKDALPTPFSGFDGIDIGTDSDSTRSVAVGNVNNDGFPDVVAGNNGQINRLYINNGTANPFDQVTGVDITTDSDSTAFVAVGELNGDLRFNPTSSLDLVVANNGQPNRLYINNGTANPFGGASAIDITADSDATMSVALADLNGDFRMDIVAGNNGQPNRLYLNNGTANPFDGVTSKDLTGDNDGTMSVAVVDVNGDTFPDVVAGNNGQPNRLYLNNGTADPFNGVSGVDIAADADSTLAIAVGDVNGDTFPDVVAGNNGQPNRVYLNNGTATPFNGVTGIDITADSHATTSLLLGDVDGDSLPDLIVGNNGQPNRVYLNNGTADPFNSVTGINVSADSQMTTAVAALGSFRYLVAGNDGQPNRLYRNDDFDGGTSPLTIEAGAPSDSIRVDSAGRVGIGGTSTPDATLALDVQGNLRVEGDLEITGGAKGGIIPAGVFLNRRRTASVTFSKPYAQDYVILLTAVSKRGRARFRPTVTARDATGFTVSPGGRIGNLTEIHWVTRIVGEY